MSDRLVWTRRLLPAALAALAAALGAVVSAAGAGAQASAGSCTGIGLTAAQDARVQAEMRAALPADVWRAATSGGYRFCSAFVPSTTAVIAYRLPFPKLGQRFWWRWVLRMKSEREARSFVLTVRKNTRKAITQFNFGKPPEPGERILGARSLHRFAIVGFTAIRRH